MKKMYKGVTNSPETFLKENLAQGATTMYVADGTVLGTLPTLAVIGDDQRAETVLVKSGNGTEYTIQRAFEGTDKTWTKGTVVARNFTNYDYQTLVDNITELSNKKIPTKLSELENDKAFMNENEVRYFFEHYTGDLRKDVRDYGVMIVDLDNIKADKTELPKKLSDLADDSTHRTVTDVEKNKLAGVETGAQKNKVNSVNNMTGDVKIDLSDYALARRLENVYNELNIGKVDKKDGKGLSTNDYTTAEKTKLNDCKRCIVKTQAEYDGLSNTEKQRDDTLYFIKG